MSQRPAPVDVESMHSKNDNPSKYASNETFKLPPMLNKPSVPSQHSQKLVTNVTGFAMDSYNNAGSAACTATYVEQAASRPLKIHHIVNSTELSPKRTANCVPILGTTLPPTDMYSLLGTTLPVASRLLYGLKQHITTRKQQSSEANIPTPLSQSNSLSTSYSSCNQPCHTFPGLTFSTPTSQRPTSQYYNDLGRIVREGSEPETVLEAASSDQSGAEKAGQSSYQLMTLNTSKGCVQIPVEVQTASTSAGQKRKRNSYASAKFRQRRKEKDNEASKAIENLQNEIQEILKEGEYYRAERNYFRDLVYKSSLQGLAVPRPPSPKRQKTFRQTSAPEACQINPQGEQMENRGEH